jgi:Ion channel
MSFFPTNELHSLRQKYIDRLVTLLTILLLLMIFVFTPLQAAGLNSIRVLEVFALLAIIAGVLVISTSKLAVTMMSVAFATIVIVIGYRLFWPTTFDLHIVAAAWLIITFTLGVVVAKAVFRAGRVTYHRIIGAVLLYLLTALTFTMLFTFVGLSFPDSFKGMSFEYDAAFASTMIYLSFVTFTSTGYGDIVPVHPLARSLCNLEAVIGQLYPAILIGRLVTLELRESQQ